MRHKKTSRFKKLSDKLPPIGMNVWVQCDGYRRMAYRAAGGKWNDSYNHQELADVIGVLEMNWPIYSNSQSPADSY